MRVGSVIVSLMAFSLGFVVLLTTTQAKVVGDDVASQLFGGDAAAGNLPESGVNGNYCKITSANRDCVPGPACQQDHTDCIWDKPHVGKCRCHRPQGVNNKCAVYCTDNACHPHRASHQCQADF